MGHTHYVAQTATAICVGHVTESWMATCISRALVAWTIVGRRSIMCRHQPAAAPAITPITGQACVKSNTTFTPLWPANLGFELRTYNWHIRHPWLEPSKIQGTHTRYHSQRNATAEQFQFHVCHFMRLLVSSCEQCKYLSSWNFGCFLECKRGITHLPITDTKTTVLPSTANDEGNTESFIWLPTPV